MQCRDARPQQRRCCMACCSCRRRSAAPRRRRSVHTEHMPEHLLHLCWRCQVALSVSLWRACPQPHSADMSIGSCRCSGTATEQHVADLGWMLTRHREAPCEPGCQLSLVSNPLLATPLIVSSFAVVLSVPPLEASVNNHKRTRRAYHRDVATLTSNDRFGAKKVLAEDIHSEP